MHSDTVKKLLPPNNESQFTWVLAKINAVPNGFQRIIDNILLIHNPKQNQACHTHCTYS